ncbi:hypothetical protein TNCV_1037231 [Trichonephila clavipes]|nr:hypothetical protein TNCV_1037231 [Trichonephila clavipes]
MNPLIVLWVWYSLSSAGALALRRQEDTYSSMRPVFRIHNMGRDADQTIVAIVGEDQKIREVELNCSHLDAPDLPVLQIEYDEAIYHLSTTSEYAWAPLVWRIRFSVLKLSRRLPLAVHRSTSGSMLSGRLNERYGSKRNRSNHMEDRGAEEG